MLLEGKLALAGGWGLSQNLLHTIILVFGMPKASQGLWDVLCSIRAGTPAPSSGHTSSGLAETSFQRLITVYVTAHLARTLVGSIVTFLPAQL